MAMALTELVEDAIARVDDPCSLAAKAPLNVFELGLVRDWGLDEDGHVHVTVSPTSPSCVLIGSISRGIEERVGAVPGVQSVTVDVDAEAFWTPDLMTDTGRQKLRGRRQGSMERVPVRPHEWRRRPLSRP